VAHAFLAPGLNAVFSAHAFAVYPIATQAAGAQGKVVPARDWGHDLDAMADAIDLAASGFLRQRQQLFQCGEVSGSGYFQALLVVAQLPVKHGFRAAQAFGQALQGESRLSFVDQGELDRRATAVDHQDVASRHRISSI